MGNLQIWEKQLLRLGQFPADRIPFYKGSATADRAAFLGYEQGKWGFEALRKMIAKNNFLPLEAVTAEKLENEMRICGWRIKSSENLSKEQAKNGSAK